MHTLRLNSNDAKQKCRDLHMASTIAPVNTIDFLEEHLHIMLSLTFRQVHCWIVKKISSLREKGT
jgi:hypothetical protein